MPKYVFVTGGVVSSLGKGIVAASIGLLLKSRGFNVAHQKLDPYLNIDPGTMNPKEHGEVYVTEDGAETDLDLGYYERFTGVQTSRNSSFSAGRIYDIILKKERKGGEYFGKTVQVVPHVVNEIQNAIRSVANENTDVVIVEIGGTVGDIESFPFLEALRLFRQKEGYKNVYFIHVSLVPYLRKADEIKTKPTQHSVARLREIGIIPNMLVCRSEKFLDRDIREKLGMFCNVDTDSVLESPDVKNTIYECPIEFANQNIDTQILEHFGLKYPEKQIDEWIEYIENITKTEKEVTVALVGKYTQVPDAYKSINESLIYAATSLKTKVIIKTISAETLETNGKGDLEKARQILKNADGILVPGGFGDRGIEGKITAVKYAREEKIPFFGICLGMQMAVIEFARSALGYEDACSREVNKNTTHPVIALMNSQMEVVDKGGTMRLGAYPCKLNKNSLAHKLYGEENIHERHRHRYEFNNEYREEFIKNGLILSGLSPDEQLVEIIELKDHPHFIGVQFHPEFKSRPVKPHPLFTGFIEASINTKEKKND
ncbi:MAG: CTP synthase [Chitinivibrionia bacterium]|nr:CTP synthase [Chitinivibrionia bacterium]